MKTMTFVYPGDPPAQVVEMSRAEFLEAYPRTPIKIITAHSVEEVPMEPDCILCDFCNDDPGDTVFVVYGTKGICRACAERSILPYCKTKLN